MAGVINKSLQNLKRTLFYDSLRLNNIQRQLSIRKYLMLNTIYGPKHLYEIIGFVYLKVAEPTFMKILTTDGRSASPFFLMHVCPAKFKLANRIACNSFVS